MEIKAKQKLLSIDFLRVLAALMVFLFHININLGFTTYLKSIDIIISVGANFMVLFIMLSGFSLHLNYGNVDILMDKRDLLSFYKKRVFRIYPSYWIFLIIVFVFHCSFPSEKIQTLLLVFIDILGLQSWFPKAWNFFGNGGTWFITVIVTMYILYPLISKIIKSVNKIIISIFCYISIVLIGYARLILGGDFAAYYALPTFRIFEFTIGVILAELVVKKEKSRKEVSWKNMIGCILLMLLYFLSINYLYDMPLVGYTFGQNYLSYNFILIPIFAGIIYCFYNMDFSFLPKKIQRIIVFCSKLTFPFYLTQTFANRIIRIWITTPFLGIVINGNKKILFSSFVLNLIFALALYYIEKLVISCINCIQLLLKNVEQ